MQQKAQFSQHLNSIIDHAQSFHVNKTPMPEVNKQKYVMPGKSKRGKSREKADDNSALAQVLTGPKLASSFGFEFAPGMTNSF